MRGVRWVCWAVLALSLVGCGEEARGGHLGTVNRVLGDVSWVVCMVPVSGCWVWE